jgi:hypothetical protein
MPRMPKATQKKESLWVFLALHFLSNASTKKHKYVFVFYPMLFLIFEKIRVPAVVTTTKK